MKISISKTIQTELEVFKYWTNPNSLAVFQLLSQDTCLMAINSKNYPSVMVTSINLNFSENSIEITEDQFNAALNETKQYLGCY